MVWLASQMWILLALSLLLGLLVGWWIWRRPPINMDEDADKELANLRARIEECDAEKTILRARLLEFEAERSQNASVPTKSETEPFLYESPTDGDPDDLKLINGIGPHLEKLLNELGVYYFHQIAAWTDGQTGTVNDRLRFKGRILRDNWRRQASELAAKN